MTIITLNNKLFSMSLYLSGSIVNFLNKYWHLCVYTECCTSHIYKNQDERNIIHKTKLTGVRCVPMLILMWFSVYFICCVVCRRLILNLPSSSSSFFFMEKIAFNKTKHFFCVHYEKKNQTNLFVRHTPNRNRREAHLTRIQTIALNKAHHDHAASYQREAKLYFC